MILTMSRQGGSSLTWGSDQWGSNGREACVLLSCLSGWEQDSGAARKSKVESNEQGIVFLADR